MDCFRQCRGLLAFVPIIYYSVMAARQGTNLKKLIENLLDKTAEEYDDSEAYRYMTENYPDGKVKLDKNERKEFMDWLGVVEK